VVFVCCSRDICSGRSRSLAPVSCSYAEAHKIKLKSDALEAWELEKWHSERQQDLLQKEAKFKFNKQQVSGLQLPLHDQAVIDVGAFDFWCCRSCWRCRSAFSRAERSRRSSDTWTWKGDLRCIM
jgi:hypothetical protein